MDASSVAQLQAWLIADGYLLLLPLSILEGPIVTVLAGSITAGGFLNSWTVLGIVVLGDLIGDTVFYSLGRWGTSFLMRYSSGWVGLTPAKLAQLRSRFAARGRSTLVVGKLTHSIGALVLVAAGAARMNYLEFLLINLVTTIPKSAILLLVGYYLGQGLQHLTGSFAYLPLIMLLVGAVLIIVIFARRETRSPMP
ncbi:MAG: VTT domain-containing protein [Geminicoccaceae bacterium]